MCVWERGEGWGGEGTGGVGGGKCCPRGKIHLAVQGVPQWYTRCFVIVGVFLLFSLRTRHGSSKLQIYVYGQVGGNNNTM